MAVEARVTLLEQRLSRIEGILEQIDKRIDDVNRRIDELNISLNRRIDDLNVSLNKRIDELRNDLKTDLRWFMGISVTIWISTVIPMLLRFLGVI